MRLRARALHRDVGKVDPGDELQAIVRERSVGRVVAAPNAIASVAAPEEVGVGGAAAEELVVAGAYTVDGPALRVSLTTHDTGGGELLVAQELSGEHADVVAVADATVIPSNWYHVAGVYDGASLRLYLDGQLLIETRPKQQGLEWPVSEAAAYVELLKVAYRRAKEANPDVVVLAGALAPTLEPPGSPAGLATSLLTATSLAAQVYPPPAGQSFGAWLARSCTRASLSASTRSTSTAS